MSPEESPKAFRKSSINASEFFTFTSLKRFNRNAGILHLIQGVAMLFLGLLLEYKRNIYTFYLNIDIISTDPFVFEVLPSPQIIFTIDFLGAIISSFLLISALAHFAIAYPLNVKYNDYLKKGMNPYRWYEYAFSSSIMIVVIALNVGIWDFWSLAMIFVLNAMMIMFGYLMELINQRTEKTTWSPFILGSISGGLPWVVIFAYFIAAIYSVAESVPTFVYMIIFTYFILFNIFAINMLLQYKGIGPWKRYLFGERVYIILSLVAKTLLAWIVFIGVFAPF